MNLYYKNGILFIDLYTDLNLEQELILERRIFNILDEYEIDKVTITTNGNIEKLALNTFKRNYYHKYKGYLIIK